MCAPPWSCRIRAPERPGLTRSAATLPRLDGGLAIEHHPLSNAVQYWEQQAAEQVLFCTVTALGLVRLVCQPKLLVTAVRNAAEASALLAKGFQQGGSPLPATWSAAGQIGWRLVSSDRDVELFAGLEGLLLP